MTSPMKNTLTAILDNPATRWLAMFFVLALFFSAWHFCAASVPFEDDYDAILAYLSHPGAERWRHLLDLHNEHRIGTTRIIAELIVFIKGSFDFRICIFIGNLFMVALATLWYRKFRYLGQTAAGIMVFTLSLSLVHWANQFSALCSIQNILAVLLPLLALLSLDRKSPAAICISMALAVLATYTSGSGVLVWPAMFMAELLFRRRRNVLIILTITAIIAAGTYFTLPNPRPPQVVKDVAAPDELLLAKTTVMGYAIEITPMFIIRHIAFAANYFLACVGGVVPIPWANVAIGLLFTVTSGWILLTFRRTQTPAFLGFLLYLLACCASCGVFRAASFMAEIPSRYQIVCTSLFATLLYLVLERKTSLAKMLTRIMPYAFCLVLLLSTAYYVYAFPILRTHANDLETNTFMWPKTCAGLQYYPDERRPHAAAIMKQVAEKGVYDPVKFQPKGFVPPVDPIPPQLPVF